MTSERNKLVYTLGTSTRSLGEFIGLLASHGVEVVVDVRRFPSSRLEHFSGKNMSRALGEAGIDYVHMGEELGGYRHRGYQTFTTTSEFQEGVNKLAKVAGERRVAIVCAERLPWRCHRRFISTELGKQGWQVSHIIDQERDWLLMKNPVTGGSTATMRRADYV